MGHKFVVVSRHSSTFGDKCGSRKCGMCGLPYVAGSARTQQGVLAWHADTTCEHHISHVHCAQTACCDNDVTMFPCMPFTLSFEQGTYKSSLAPSEVQAGQPAALLPYFPFSSFSQLCVPLSRCALIQSYVHNQHMRPSMLLVLSVLFPRQDCYMWLHTCTFSLPHGTG